MLNQIITPPRAWTAESAGDRHDWTIDLPGDLVADYAEGEADELDASSGQIARWRSLFEPALDELNSGKRTFCVSPTVSWCYRSRADVRTEHKKARTNSSGSRAFHHNHSLWQGSFHCNELRSSYSFCSRIS
jgi:hypothetical protein